MQTTSSRTKMKTINGDSLTPILIFRRLQGQHKFLLESSAQHEGAGRFSFIGANPRKTYKGIGDEIEELSYKTGQTYMHQGDLFVLLKRLMPRVSNTTQFPFSGGAVGYVSCKSVSSFTAKHEQLQLPDVHFHVYETIIVFDHMTDEVTLIYTNIDAEKKEPDLEKLAEQLINKREEEDTACGNPLLKSTSTEQVVAALKNIKEVLDGENARVVLSNQFLAKLDGDSFALYRNLRRKNPAPYMYYVTFDDHIVMGTSPESLVRVKGDRVIATSIEGGYKRSLTNGEDVENERKLAKNGQVKKSHMTLVKAVQHELQSVCIRDSIQMIDAMDIERSKRALYMTSQIEGTMYPMLHALDVLKATLPVRASVNASIEESAGVFNKAIGFIGFNGHLDFSLTGRSIVVANEMLHMQTTITATKYTDVDELIEQVTEGEQFFLQLLHEEGSGY